MAIGAMSIAKRLGATLLTLLVWELVNVTFAHWWAISTASEEVMGLMQFFAREILRNAPASAYFFSVGVVFGVTMGAHDGGRWAVFAAAVAMGINALLAKYMFYEGISYIEVALLVTNYGLPIALAAAGALFVHKWRHINRGAAET